MSPACDDQTYFNTIFEIPESLKPTAWQIVNFASCFVEVDAEDKKSFQWGNFTDAVNAYGGDDLTVSKYQNTNIHQETATVDTMVQKITAYLQGALSVTLGDKDIEYLTDHIKDTFTNLKETQEHGWADFSKTIHGYSSWEYRLVVAFPNPDLQEYFYALVTTIDIKADILEESTWWGLSRSTKKDFSAGINVMELAVKDGFKNPTDSASKV